MGIIILVNELHFANAPDSIFLMLAGNFTFDNELQPSKAFSPIVVTVSGMFTLSISDLFLNTLVPTTDTIVLSNISGITSLTELPQYDVILAVLSSRISYS